MTFCLENFFVTNEMKVQYTS